MLKPNCWRFTCFLRTTYLQENKAKQIETYTHLKFWSNTKTESQHAQILQKITDPLPINKRETTLLKKKQTQNNACKNLEFKPKIYVTRRRSNEEVEPTVLPVTCTTLKKLDINKRWGLWKKWAIKSLEK